MKDQEIEKWQLENELYKSFEDFKFSSDLNNYKGNIIHLINPEQEGHLVRWLLCPVETRLPFKDLGYLLKIPPNKFGRNGINLSVLIFHVLWVNQQDQPISLSKKLQDSTVQDLVTSLVIFVSFISS